MSDQFPRKEVEKFKTWARLGFTWNKFVANSECENCSYTCKSLNQAKKHFKSHNFSSGGMK